MKGWTSARPFCSVADGKRASLLHIWIANVLWVFVQNPVYRKSLPSMFYDPQHFRQTRMLAIIQSLRANVFNSFPKFWFSRSRLSPEFPQIIHFIFWTEKININWTILSLFISTVEYQTGVYLDVESSVETANVCLQSTLTLQFS